MDFAFNPNNIMQMLARNKNPQQFVLSMFEQQAGSTPMGANLLNLAKNGQTQEIEKIARNMCRERGVDFDQEFAAFKRMFGFG